MPDDQSRPPPSAELAKRIEEIRAKARVAPTQIARSARDDERRERSRAGTTEIAFGALMVLFGIASIAASHSADPSFSRGFARYIPLLAGALLVARGFSRRAR